MDVPKRHGSTESGNEGARPPRGTLRRAVGLLGLDTRRVALAVLTGTLALGCAVALAAVSAWLIARASQMPPVLQLSVATVAVRTFGIGRGVLRYLDRLVSHDVALRGMTNLRTTLYTRLAAGRTEATLQLRRGDLLARVGADVDAVGDVVVRGVLPAGVALLLGVGTVTAMACFWPPAAAALAVCLLLAGVVAPLLAARGARAAERRAVAARADASATALAALDDAGPLLVAGGLDRRLAELRDADRRLAKAVDSGATSGAVAAGLGILATGLAATAALVTGVPAVASGALSPVELAVIVLTPLAAFEATGMLPAAAVSVQKSRAAAARILALLDEAGPGVTPSAGSEPRPARPAGEAGAPTDSVAARGRVEAAGTTGAARTTSAAGTTSAARTTSADGTTSAEGTASASRTVATTGAARTKSAARTTSADGTTSAEGTASAARTAATTSAARTTSTARTAASAQGAGIVARGLACGWPGLLPVLTGVDLDVAPGRAVAVVGPSGAGKTTLLLTLAGLLPPAAGTLRVGGDDPTALSPADRASRVVVTTEDAHVFGTTVLENLRVARGDVTPDEASSALAAVGLDGWLAALPDGLDTLLGPDARTVSGGERRRLLLARALLAPARLLLVDEPAEHLDPATADALVTALLTGPRTPGGRERGVVVVTHRLTPLAAADEVLWVQDGRVTARGTHAELSGRLLDYGEAVRRERVAAVQQERA